MPVSDCTLRKGRTYWLNVQVHMDFNDFNQVWYWSTTNELVGSADLWKNHGEGWGLGCPHWSTVFTCTGWDYAYLFSVNRA